MAKKKRDDAKVNKDAAAYGMPGEPGGPAATVPPTPGEPSTDEPAPGYNPDQFVQPGAEKEGAARELEPGVRVEAAKAGDPVPVASSATGELIDPPGKIKAHQVTGRRSRT
jgi:hypothetical protein